MKLSTDNIRLRKLDTEDLTFLYLIENDEKAWECSDTHNPLSHRDLVDYMVNSTGDIYRDGQLRLVIESNDAEKNTLGCIDIFDLDIRNSRAAIGIYVIDEYRKQNVATEAVELVVKYASEFLHLRMLYAFVDSNNVASKRLFEKNGFRIAARLDNWYLTTDAVVFVCMLQ